MNNDRVFYKDSLVELLERLGAVFEGDKCTCPFHEDRNPSAGVYVDDKGHWRFRCFSCDLTLDYLDITRRENITIPKEPVQKEKHVYASLDEAAGECEARYSYADIEGNLLAVKTRFTPPDGKRGKGYSIIKPYYGGFQRACPEPPYPLYAQTHIRGAKAVVVVEGEKCADALNEMGIPATTSIGSGGKLVTATDWSPVYGKKIVIWPDNDKTGQNYKDLVAAQLLPYCTISVVDPVLLDLKEKEDVADYIEKGHGKLDIRLALNEACKNTPASEVNAYIEGMIDGSIRAIEWPWPMLHRYSQALLPGTVTVVVGPPGCSKSFMLMEALAFWLDKGEKVALYALEENATFHLLRALSQKANMPDITRPDWVKAHPEEVREAWIKHKDHLNRMAKHLYALPTRQTNLKEMIAWITEQCKAGCRIITVDPITAAAHGKAVWEADSEFILASKQIADKYKVSLIYVTHPTKIDAAPCVGNIRGGAAYQQFVQNIFWVEKTGLRYAAIEGAESTVINRRIHILKARNAAEMKTGVIAYTLTKGLKFYEHGEFKKYEDE